MTRQNRAAERRNRLTIELAVCGLGPYAIAARTGLGQHRVTRLLRGVGIGDGGGGTPRGRPP